MKKIETCQTRVLIKEIKLLNMRVSSNHKKIGEHLVETEVRTLESSFFETFVSCVNVQCARLPRFCVNIVIIFADVIIIIKALTQLVPTMLGLTT